MAETVRTLGTDGIWREPDGSESYPDRKKSEPYGVRYPVSDKQHLIPSVTVPEVEDPPLESIDGVVSYVKKLSLPVEEETFMVFLFQIETSIDNFVILGEVILENGFHVRGEVRTSREGSYTNSNGVQKEITYKQVDKLDIFGLSGNHTEIYPS